MANVNNFDTNYQETVKLTKAQSTMVRNIMSDTSQNEILRVDQVENYLTNRIPKFNTVLSDKNELIVRVGDGNKLTTTYYFKYTPSISGTIQND